MLAIVTNIDVLTYIGGACSLLMVGGSLFLIYKGILTFKEVNPEEAIKVEFQKALSIQTRYPAIALFVVGIIFLGVSLYFAQKNAIRPLIVTGSLDSVDADNATVVFSEDFGTTTPSSTGEIRQKIWPNIDEVKIEIATPGHEPGKIKAIALIDKDQNVLSFGKVKAGKKVIDASAIAVAPANIASSPSNPTAK